jgi:hypothetical protein
MTGCESCSLGADEYWAQITTAGLSLVGEYEDEGRNYYFEAVRNEPR